MSSEPEKKETPDVSLSLPTGGTWSGGDIRIIAFSPKSRNRELQRYFSRLDRLISVEPTAPMAPTWRPHGATIEESLEEAQSMLDSMQEVEEDIPASYFGLVGLFRKICD